MGLGRGGGGGSHGWSERKYLPRGKKGLLEEERVKEVEWGAGCDGRTWGGLNCYLHIHSCLCCCVRTGPTLSQQYKYMHASLTAALA